MIFVDTGAWFTRFVADDPLHAALDAWFASNKLPLVTTDYCVDELLTLLAARRRPSLSATVGKILFEESLAKLHFLGRSQIERAGILFQSKVYTGWSFTDCTSKIVIDDLSISTALALDDHFRQFGVSVVPALN